MSKISIDVVYVSGINTQYATFTEKNYDDIENYEDSLEAVFQSDDYGIDGISVSGTKVDLDWTSLLSDGSRLNQEMVNLIFEDSDPDEAFMKMKFSEVHGVDIEEIYIYDASKDNWLYGNYDCKYPEGLVDEWADDFYPDLVKALEKANAEMYLEWARIFSDNEVNGDFITEIYGDYFVYAYH